MTMADCFLGVDGGGTKTRFALIDGNGSVLAQAQHGTTYHPQVGWDGVREILTLGLEQVLADAALPASSIRYAFFGLPAYGEDSQAAACLDTIPGEILGHAARLAAEGKLRPMLDAHRFTLGEVDAAHARMASGQARGKIAVDVSAA
jgi:N-acetylglucosamine kinase-like BadF-type ATPase